MGELCFPFIPSIPAGVPAHRAGAALWISVAVDHLGLPDVWIVGEGAFSYLPATDFTYCHMVATQGAGGYWHRLCRSPALRFLSV